MKSLAIAKTLEGTFRNRGLRQHCASRSVQAFDYGANRAMLVFDLEMSRKILSSKAFSGFNYFQEGVDHLAAQGVPIDFINRFYQETILFKEGPSHHATKLTFHRLLDDLCREIDTFAPRIRRFMEKRKGSMASPLDFATLITRLCLGWAISRLMSVPLRAAMRALQVRQNVFFYYFHPIRQQRANHALARLCAAAATPSPGSPEHYAHMLAQSLMVMGYDPLIGSICASLVEGSGLPLEEGPARFCPVSFVSRICLHPVTILGTHYDAGDVCYVALAPASDETARPASFPFGLGTHACIGRRFSLAILRIADTIVQGSFSEGFPCPSRLAPDGAFLAFAKEN